MTTTNSIKLKIRDLVGVNDFPELIRRLEDWSDRLSVWVPRIEPVAQITSGETFPTSTSTVTLDFSNDGAPAGSVGLVGTWVANTSSDASLQTRRDASYTWSSHCAAFDDQRNIILFTADTQSVLARLDTSVTVNSQAFYIDGWIY